jgi:predicted outer membrane repeat protein
MARSLFAAIMATLVCIGLASGQVIHIPADYPTIQEGIDAANEGDTVLVAPGTYVENDSLRGRNITLASHFLTTGDTSYISSTIIDGGSDGRVMLIYRGEDSTTRITGFTITNGKGAYSGGGIRINESSPTLDHLYIKGNGAASGGGLHLTYSSSTIEDSRISENSCERTGFYITEGGGGIYLYRADITISNTLITGNTSVSEGGGIYNKGYSNLYLVNVDIIENTAKFGGGISMFDNEISMDSIQRCNIYSNRAFYANDIYPANTDSITVIVDTFSVSKPTDFHVYDSSKFLFDIRFGKLTQYNADFYVSDSGDDQNSGLNSGDPLKTIHAANSKMLQAAGDTNTIHLLPGTFSPSNTNEFYPIILRNLINLAGAGPNSSILDAESNGSVIIIDVNDYNKVSQIRITGGSSAYGGGIYCEGTDAELLDLKIIGNEAENGGGIYINECHPVVRNCTIESNYAMERGGGIRMHNYDYYYTYQPEFTNLLIRENEAGGAGGGISSEHFQPSLSNVTICNNQATSGGGMEIVGYPEFGSVQFDSVDRCNIYLNQATTGNDLVGYVFYDIIVDTFTVMNPTQFHASPRAAFTFDILNAKLTQVEDDVYVSPTGDNGNSGLTADDPFKTIYHAMSVIIINDSTPRNIYLLDGTFSPSGNGEYFPVNFMDNLHITGTADSLVTLDAEFSAGVVRMYYAQNNRVSDLTITGGSQSGIYLRNSDPVIERLFITGNNSGGKGGGIYCYESNPELNELGITNNNAATQGGGIYVWESSLQIDNMLLQGNSASAGGGGLFVSSNENHTSILSHIDFIGNSAGSGGGIYSGIPVTVNHCSFSENVATGNGGGLCVQDSIWLTGSVISNNSAEGGGGFYAGSYSGFAMLDSVDITGNIAADRGGGVLCDETSKVYLNNVIISGNNAGDRGGGINCSRNSFLSLSATTIAHNHGSVGGGIAWSLYPNAIFDTVNRCNIYLNTAPMGSDLLSSNDTIHVVVDTFTVMYPTEYHAYSRDMFMFDIQNAKIEQIDADVYVSTTGDDANSGLTPDDPFKTIDHAFSKLRLNKDHQNTIHLANGTYSKSTTGERFPINIINHCSLIGESRWGTILDGVDSSRVLNAYRDTIPLIKDLTITGGNSYAGAGVKSYVSDMYLFNVRITDNFSDDEGGGIYCSSGGKMVLRDVQLDHNMAGTGGGMNARYMPALEIYNTVVAYNKATSGAGIFLDRTDSLWLEGSKIQYNTCGQMGGGMYMYLSESASIVNTQFESNNALKGGGLWSVYSSPHIRSSLFADNFASQQAGGVGIYEDHYELDSLNSLLTNVTFTGNNNVALLCYRDGLKLTNNIFWDNAGPAQVLHTILSSDSDTLWVQNSDIQDGIDGFYLNGPVTMIWPEGNIDQDPLFMLSGDHPYCLEDGSPCVDAGTQDTTGLLLPYNDITGNTRVWDGDGNGTHIIDMGPYEYGAPVEVTEPVISDDGIRVYPNPAREYFFIQNRENTSEQHVSMLNNLGQEVFSTIIPGGQESFKINLDHIPEGLYSVFITTGGRKIYSNKVLVVR